MSNDLEPWLRGTLGEVDPLRRAVIHALELAAEDVAQWCDDLSDEEMLARPAGLPPIAFQLRHIGRSLDRLLTYAEGGILNESQFLELNAEQDATGTTAEVLTEVRERLAAALKRVMLLHPESFAETRGVGRRNLPTTVAGLLIHCAEHTQRHIGQMVTTVKIVRRINEL